MNKIDMDLGTLHDGAVSCRRIAVDGGAVARQVKAVPVPAHVPPEALSQIHDAMNQIQRSAISAERQALFLLQTFHAGQVADAPGGARAHIHIPGLLSPWAKSAKPHKSLLDRVEDAAGSLLHVAKGALDDLVGTARGFADTAIALSAVELDAIVPGASEHVPGLARRKRQFERGVDWAIHHPGEVFKQIGKDMVAWDLWKRHHYAEAIGHNVVGFAELFLAVGSLGKAGKAVHAGTAGEKAAARVAKIEHATARGLQAQRSGLTGSTTAGHAAAAGRSTVAELRARMADQRIVAAHARTEAARADARGEIAKLKEQLADKVKGLPTGAALAPAGHEPEEKP
jgi:hypothetical protein